ncbi:hypothetical protein E6P09_18695 (plasmid) [Haloferax mediterranei ATCC 33500]|uniref:Uncharacterized protein n=1 Tax=Haloferax mediterranei (strain ATCC 33500 / DSM 1411 / JCM 8866 / NBRC 14739 / NCIMB 2177 / R-4) TaxID=523841 RepID=I3R9J9_HALMT|nr:hypothetical protein [Haloferax mediterranei]AFK20909.1 hypothetical protein HFX_5075 [Haloferax mediterranei ATCC 33500]AHZ24221.1 hypothetical protein BM92_18640 [Haloferax mediterranei ATCC 33500]EMA05300.1 hypothetical protein C439_00835 [Haloferax mediterranei ATCC 33500]MDX5989898.1 hypothetical protein [Haloferax mediterranei ATCC 33500]QCQ77339.1 hypothetical protein E6P09_18695 [Haloferax mediterranei ATCC 33500]
MANPRTTSSRWSFVTSNAFWTVLLLAYNLYELNSASGGFEHEWFLGGFTATMLGALVLKYTTPAQRVWNRFERLSAGTTAGILFTIIVIAAGLAVAFELSESAVLSTTLGALSAVLIGEIESLVESS